MVNQIPPAIPGRREELRECTSFFSIRYATRKGVPEMTSSRVPATRPFRPAMGWPASSCVLSQILSAVRAAAARFSSAMYSYALTNCSRAGVVQRTRIAVRYFARRILAISFFISASGTKSPLSAARKPFLISLM